MEVLYFLFGNYMTFHSEHLKWDGGTILIEIGKVVSKLELLLFLYNV